MDPLDSRAPRPDQLGPRSRLPTLTSLRFFAAALVVVVHLQLVWPNAVLQRGQVGVSFFYVLSGFILAWAPSDTDTPSRFYRRRFARIFPVHLLTWIVAILVVLPIEGHVGFSLGDALALILVQAWIPTSTIAFAANGVSWSLSVEVLFYALFPIALIALKKFDTRMLQRVAVLAVAIMVVITIFAPRDGLVYIFPPSRLPEFIIGIALSLLVQRGWTPPLSFAAALLLSVGLVLLDFSPVIPTRWTFAMVTVVPFGLLIAAAAKADLSNRPPLGGTVWVHLGESSFALFMTHQLILKSYAALVPDGPRQIFLIPVLLLCLGVAQTVFRYIERPLERRLRGPRAEVAGRG